MEPRCKSGVLIVARFQGRAEPRTTEKEQGDDEDDAMKLLTIVKLGEMLASDSPHKLRRCSGKLTYATLLLFVPLVDGGSMGAQAAAFDMVEESGRSVTRSRDGDLLVGESRRVEGFVAGTEGGVERL